MTEGQIQTGGRHGYMPGLDGLRGALLAGIIAYHLGFAPTGMFVTVDGFFALSGFLITSLLLARPLEQTADLRRWWGRRIRRLMPAAAVTIAVTVVVFSGATMARDGFAALTWWANWNQVLSGDDYWTSDTSPLRHFWSLSIEEQFYLVWPLTVVGVTLVAAKLGRSTSRWVAGAAAIGAAASYGWSAWLAQTGTDPNRLYLGSDTRAGAVLLGCAAAAWLYGRTPPRRLVVQAAGWLGLATAVVLCLTLTFTSVVTYSGGLAVGGIAWTAVVIALSRPGLLTSLFSGRALRWAGVRSYGIYLWAWPLQVGVERAWPGGSTVLVAAVVVSGALVLGDLSHRLIERPLRESAGWAVRPRARAMAWTGGTGLVAVALIAAFVLAPTPPEHERISTEESAAIALAAAAESATTTLPPTTTTEPAPAPAVPGAAPAPEPSPPPEPEPIPPPDPEPLRVISAGDSQAFTAASPAPTPDQLPDHIGSVTVAGVLGCGVLVRLPGWRMVDHRNNGQLVDGTYCEAAEQAETAALEAGADWMVIFSGGFERAFSYRLPDGRVLPARHPELRATVAEQLTRRIERANAHGARVALLEWACMGREVGNAEAADWTRWHNSILREVAEQVPGTITIPPTEAVCVGADPTGEPTPEKERAWGNEVHPQDRGWLWTVQIGPALRVASGA